jgi:hypothetical protein
LRELLGDDELRARMAETAHAHAAATSWDANAARVLAAYREVLGS